MRLVPIKGYERKSGVVVPGHASRRGVGKPLAERIERFTVPEPNTGCWLWGGTVDTKGYGQLHVGGRLLRAHRVSYELNKGAIPAGLELDHKCRVRRCVNPEHLEPVTHRENLRRGGLLRRRESCKNGHPLTPENLRKNGRMCAVCHRDRERERSRRSTPSKPSTG
jgi:hypothetical protein